MKLDLTDKEVAFLKSELFDLIEALRESCECKPNTSICGSCQKLPFVHNIVEKLNA